jgi:FAD synthase
MEGGMAETLQSFSRILGRAVTDGAHTPRYLGVVARGARRAGALGFPTLNIVLPDLHLSGVYAARVEIGGQTRDAAAFADPSRNVLEAHLLDFSENVPAGTPITIELFEKMRDSEKFNNDEALKSAIASDISDIKKYFVTHLQP